MANSATEGLAGTPGATILEISEWALALPPRTSQPVAIPGVARRSRLPNAGHRGAEVPARRTHRQWIPANASIPQNSPQTRSKKLRKLRKLRKL